jgi:hypothetical protein
MGWVALSPMEPESQKWWSKPAWDWLKRSLASRHIVGSCGL